MRMLFLQPVLSEEVLANHRVASHASSAWCRGLYHGVLAQGVQISAIGHIPAQIWPLECKVYPGLTSQFEAGFDQHLVNYFNLPFVRTYSLCQGYRKALRSVVRDDRPIVCTYNPLPWQVAAGQYAVQCGCQWFSFVLDDDWVVDHGWAHYEKQSILASGHIFVSQWAYEHARVQRKLLFQGGIEAWQGEEQETLSKSPSIMFSGLLGDASGVKELISMIDCIKSKEVEFWICGKGNSAELAQHAAKDKRIKLLGFLSENRLHERLRSAWVLVNPRSATHEGNRMNFPSKLLRYLSYGKPVVTLWTSGIPDVYRELMQVVDPDIAGTSAAQIGDAMARMVNDTLTWNDETRLACKTRIRDFMVPEMLWTNQARRLRSFIRTVTNVENGEITQE